MPRIGNTAALRMRLEVDDNDFQNELAEYAVVTGNGVAATLRDQARLLVGTLVKLTPPFRSRNAQDESFNDQRKVGQEAIRKDVSRVFLSIEEIADKNQVLRNPLHSALSKNAHILPGQSLPELLQRAGVMKDADPTRILDEPTVAIHNQFRKSRGRVIRNVRNPYFVKRSAAIQRFVRERWADIGRGKGGWGISAFRYGFKLPAWIGVHRSGGVDDQAFRHENPYVRVINNVSYLEKQNQVLRIVDYALADRAKALERQLAVLVKKKFRRAA